MNKLDWTVLSALVLIACIFWLGVAWLVSDRPVQTEQQAMEYYDVLNSFTVGGSVSIDLSSDGFKK